MVAIITAASSALLLPSGVPPWPATPRKVKVTAVIAVVEPHPVALAVDGCQSRKASRLSYTPLLTA